MLKIDEGTGDFGFMARFLDWDSTLASLHNNIDFHKTLSLLYYNDTLITKFGSPYKIATLNPDSKVTIEIIHETEGKLGEQTVAPVTEAVFGLENTPEDTKFPIWLKLTRYGNSFTGYISLDGKTWINEKRTNNIPGLAEAIDLGLAAGSPHKKPYWVEFEDWEIKVAK